MAIVYKHTRLDNNEVFYIGIGKTEKRAYNKYNRSNFWKNVANKGYKVDIIYSGLTWNDACEKEKELIKLYGRKDLNNGSLVNMTDGGEGTINLIMSDDAKKRISDYAIKRQYKPFLNKSLPEETKTKLSHSISKIRNSDKINIEKEQRLKEYKDKVIKQDKNEIKNLSPEEKKQRQLESRRIYKLTEKGRAAKERYKQTDKYKEAKKQEKIRYNQRLKEKQINN